MRSCKIIKYDLYTLKKIIYKYEQYENEFVRKISYLQLERLLHLF